MHSIGELQKFYETGTLIHHKNKSTMKKPDELKHTDGGEGNAPTQEAAPTAPAAEATPTAEAANAGTIE